MVNPPPYRATTDARTYRSKNAKAATEIQEDPELWRDIHNNVRKMDDLYDATFYTWLKSEDNVLVTASYLQRLAGEYDHDRIEHALCWLVHGWRLESIAVLVKQVTFDWIHVHGEQGEKNRARLVLALTDNWAIQYIARLAGTLLTSAATPSPPPTLLTFTPCHSRIASLPGSPATSPSLTSAAAAWGAPSQQSSARPTSALSTPSSPRSSHQPLSTFNTPQPTQGRRMAVSRRLGSPMAIPSADEVAMAVGRPASMSPAAESHSNGGYRSNHHRQSSSTLPGQQQHPPQHPLLQQRQSSSSLSSDHTHQGIPPLHPSASSVVNSTSNSTSSAPSIAATGAPVYPSPSQQQPPSYHPHHCTVSHHPHHHQHHPSPQPHTLSPQIQHHRQHLHRAPVQIARTTHGPHATHVRQQSQPGSISTSKQHWLQQQSSYAASPIFYMNKPLFMEELSRNWSFCRLSEFFQCLDPASGISHRFKCKLLKESGLKDELSQKQKSTASAAAVAATATGNGATSKDAPGMGAASVLAGQEEASGRTGSETEMQDTNASISVALVDEPLSEGSTGNASDNAMDIVMTDSTATSSASGSPSVVALSSVAGSSSSQPAPSSLKEHQVQQGDSSMAMHPLDTTMETVAVTCGTSSSSSSRSPSVSAPIPLVLLQQEQANASSGTFHLLQTFGHGQYKDGVQSGLHNRGFRNADGNHQHSRAQTVEAIMSKAPTTQSSGPSGLTLSPTSSTISCGSSVSSPMPSPTTTSTMAASASMSNLTLTEQPSLEPTSRPLSQQQNLSPYTTHFSAQALYRHEIAPHSVPAGSSSTISSSSSSSTTATSTVTTTSSSSGGLLTVHTNGQQQGQSQQKQAQAQQQSTQQPPRHHPHDSTSAKRKNSLGVSLVTSSNCSSFSANGSSSVNMHSSSDGSLSSSSAIFPGPRRTSTSASTTNEDLKRLRCSRQNSTSSSTSGI